MPDLESVKNDKVALKLLLCGVLGIQMRAMVSRELARMVSDFLTLEDGYVMRMNNSNEGFRKARHGGPARVQLLH